MKDRKESDLGSPDSSCYTHINICSVLSFKYMIFSISIQRVMRNLAGLFLKWKGNSLK
jgi:hypothetical protein